MINGIIIVDKEPGFTSHDVVAKLRGIFGQKRIGHTGTLDPEATGVLPVCLGNATKLCDMLTDRDKEYVAELLLGVETDTQDMTGKVLTRRDVCVTREQLEMTCREFTGVYSQIPPMYSALKVNGKKLCDLAREGKEVERRPRQVTIMELELLNVELPVVKLRVKCSKGTYIRTLCADIGERLGCGGTMKSLRRTMASGFTLDDAVTLEALQEAKETGRIEAFVRPVDSVFEDLPGLCVKEEGLALLENGNLINPALVRNPALVSDEKICVRQGWVRFYRPDGSFAGIYVYDGVREMYRPVKMFL